MSSIMARMVNYSECSFQKSAWNLTFQFHYWYSVSHSYTDMPRNCTLSKPVALAFMEFPWQELHCPIQSKKNGLCIEIFKNFVPCHILAYSLKKVGLPNLNILTRVQYFILHLILFFITVNTTKDLLDFMEYSREYFACVTSCIVLVITYLDVPVIIVLRIAQSISTTMIRDH